MKTITWQELAYEANYFNKLSPERCFKNIDKFKAYIYLESYVI